MEATQYRVIRTRTVLTRRGRIVRDVLIGLILAAAFLWANDATVPQECKVPVEQMSHACKSLLFP